MCPRTRKAGRHAAATVEFAVVLPVLLTVLVGLWEVGRIVQLQQNLSAAAREGARVAAQSQTINSTGLPTQIQVDAGSPSVKQTVANCLRQANLDVTGDDVQVEFAFLNGDTARPQPCQGEKGQHFRVTVRLPVARLHWPALRVTRVTELSASAAWPCLVDDPFQLEPAIPAW